MKSAGRKAIVFSMLIAALYVLAYFLVMARNVPAVDLNGVVRFQSSFRMAPVAGRLGPFTIEASKVTFWNYLFYPIDALFYSLAPTNTSFNTIPPLH